MTDPRIERILDRQAIGDLLTEYCRALDLMDLDAIAKVFTADCRVEYGPEERLTSHGAAGVAKSLADNNRAGSSPAVAAKNQ